MNTKGGGGSCEESGSPKTGSGPGEKFLLGPPSKGKPAKKLYAESQRLVLALSCRATWAWFERVSLHSRQVMILPRKKKTYHHGINNDLTP